MGHARARRERTPGRPKGRTTTPSPPSHALTDLQRSAGNAAVKRSLAIDQGPVQRDLFEDIGATVKGALDTLGDVAATVVGTASGKPTLRRGAKGAAVGEAQERLRQRGAALVVDNDFGKRTETAVRAFQQDMGLAVDGIIGPNTWGRLLIGGESDAAEGEQRRERAFAAASAQERADWTLLGGTEAQWNDGESPGLQATVAFADLTDPQKAAAVRLGFTRESWNQGREATADRARSEYDDEETRAQGKSGGALPAKWAGSLRSNAILDAEYGHIKSMDMPRVRLLTEAETRTTYEGFYGAGSYPAGGLEGFERDGTNYLNMGGQSADTVIHEMLHTQEHADWDALAYVGETSIGEGATEMLTKRAATRFEIPTSTSYPSEHALVSHMNTHSSQEKMIKAYMLGGAHVTTYQNDVVAGLKPGFTWATFKARIDASDIPGARAQLS